MVIESYSFTMKAQQQDAWDKRDHRDRHHRAALGARDRNPSEDRQRVDASLITRSPISSRKIPTHKPSFGLPAPFMEWAVGKQGEMMRSDTGKLLLPGSKFHWDIHYSQAGEEITSNVELGIYFYPKGQEPKFRTTLAARAGGTRHDGRASEPGHGLAELHRAARVGPDRELPGAHAPARQGDDDGSDSADRSDAGASATSTTSTSTGTTSYVYADDVAPLLPKGTILKVTAWTDNTSAKASNPDPNQWVGWGDRTVDEMAHAWVNITYMKEDDFKVEVDKRKAMQSQSTQQQQ